MLQLNYFFQGTLLIYLSESVMDDYEAGTVPPLPAHRSGMFQGDSLCSDRKPCPEMAPSDQ